MWSISDEDGTYIEEEDRTRHGFEGDTEEEEEEELERVLLEEEQYSLIIRRSFHTTPRAKK